MSDDPDQPSKPATLVITPEIRALMQAHHDDGLTDLHAFPMSDEEKQFEELRIKYMDRKASPPDEGPGRFIDTDGQPGQSK